MSKRDFYEVLGVSRTADKEEIKRAESKLELDRFMSAALTAVSQAAVKKSSFLPHCLIRSSIIFSARK